jgi:hypothetical protein
METIQTNQMANNNLNDYQDSEKNLPELQKYYQLMREREIEAQVESTRNTLFDHYENEPRD